MSTDLTETTPLDRLDPKQRMAVEFYTNPLYGKTFGNKTASAQAAGYTGNRPYEALNSVSAQEAIQWVREKQAESGKDVAKYLSQFSMAAAHKLIQQIGMDEGLQIKQMPEGLLDKPATPIILQRENGDDYIAGTDDGHLRQAKTIIDHNKAVASVAKEVRQALQLVLAYHIGTPQQKIKVEREREEQDPLDLGKMSAGKLRELARTVQDALRGEAPPSEVEGEAEDSDVVEADFEVVSEEKESDDTKDDPPAASKRTGRKSPESRGLPF